MFFNYKLNVNGTEVDITVNLSKVVLAELRKIKQEDGSEFETLFLFTDMKVERTREEVVPKLGLNNTPIRGKDGKPLMKVKHVKEMVDMQLTIEDPETIKNFYNKINSI